MLHTTVVLLALLLCALHASCVLADGGPQVAGLLRKANMALAQYDYSGALDAFNAAIEADPGAWLSYYRRSTAHQALGRTGAALEDLSAALQRNPRFSKAYLQRARIMLKEGELARARDELDALEKHTSAGDKDAAEGATLRAEVENAAKLEQQLSKRTVSKNAAECVRVASELLNSCPNHIEARRQRANCQVLQGHVEDAITDWTRLSHLAPSSELQLRLSLLSYYVLGTRESQLQDSGLAHLKACLHNDPDNKACIRAHKELRKIDKALQKARKFADSQSWSAVTSALKGAKVGGPTVRDDVERVIRDATTAHGDEAPLLPTSFRDPIGRSELLTEIDTLYCRAYVGQNLFKRAKPFCERLLARDPNNVPALVAKGEQLMVEEHYEEAVRVLSQAFEQTQHSDRDVHERLVRAQKRLKLAKAKDYYKTLGVSRDADDRTIKKAYRRLAREHHPDKGGNQEKMAEINEAFGVLGDPELRKRYDMGDDPNDPTGGQEAYANPFGGGHPFAGGGNPFQQFFQQAAFQEQFGGGQGFHFSF